MKRRILLVDDDLAILLTLKAVLELNQFSVETASSAQEAKSKLRTGTFHMVISDLRMESERAGLEVAKAAKESASRPAFALLTAFPLSEQEWQGEDMDRMLIKPVNTGEFLSQIEALLVSHEDRKRKLAQAGKSPTLRGGGERVAEPAGNPGG